MATELANKPFKSLNCLDKIYKPLILKWLTKQFGYENYPHSHKDQWIIWNIRGGELSVSFDLRQDEQVKLLELIHPRFLGCPQYETLKIVNKQSFYLNLKQLIHIDYPKILRSKLISKTKHIDNDGDVFYTYDWEVFLDDNTSIVYGNQKKYMDMIRRDYSYDSIIQERAFINFLNKLS